MTSPATVSSADGVAGAGTVSGVRLVSLLPSATEIVYALGLADQLVGVTFECDEPTSARLDKTVVVGGRDTAGMTPAEIDAYVRQQVDAGQDLYTLDSGALAALAPELILTQDLCRVCALPAGHVQQALDYLGCTADVVTLDPNSLDDVLATILIIGQRAGARPQAEHLVAALRGRLAAVAARTAGRSRPAVAMIEWTDPPFTAGHWVPDLVTAAGGGRSPPRRASGRFRRAGTPSPPPHRKSSWWHPAASISTGRQSKPGP